MGQRTQIGVNVIFVGTDGTERVRREIYHYQWGGYSNIMFENLIGFFINVRHYIYNLKNQKYSQYTMEEIARCLRDDKDIGYNILQTNLIEILKSPHNRKNSIVDYGDCEVFNNMTEKNFYESLFACDCNDGRIVIEIRLDGENSYCKWNFIKDNMEVTKNINDVVVYWEDIFTNEQEKELKNIIKTIKNFTTFTDDGKVIKTNEYDGKFFKKKFKEYFKEEK